jgi:hypothetical protein
MTNNIFNTSCLFVNSRASQSDAFSAQFMPVAPPANAPAGFGHFPMTRLPEVRNNLFIPFVT